MIGVTETKPMQTKPSKPSADFPLTPHASGKWAKKINGKVRYFGRWDDPVGAVAQYRAFLEAQSKDDQNVSLTVNAAAEAFLAAKAKAVERGELCHRSWKEYRDTCQRFATFIGHDRLVDSLGPGDFSAFRELRQQSWNLIAVGNEITRVRSLFKWCRESRLIQDVPHYGPEFKRPGMKSVRRHRRAQGKKLWTAAQIRAILDECGLQLRAMVLLGINCGFGPTDCSRLQITDLDLDRSWIHYPRPKTEVDRDCPLWPETVDSLRTWLARRSGDTMSVFLLPTGESWDNSGNPISKRFRQILLWAGIKRGGFYWLRHTFETIGGGAKDQVAVNAIMGHADGSMAATYREEIEPARLIAVTDHVRAWLFA